MGAKLPSTPQMVNDKQHTPRPHSSLIPPAASKRLAQTGTESSTPSAKTTLRPALLSSACCRPPLPPSARCHFRCFIKHRKRLAQCQQPDSDILQYFSVGEPSPVHPRHQEQPVSNGAPLTSQTPFSRIPTSIEVLSLGSATGAAIPFKTSILLTSYE